MTDTPVLQTTLSISGASCQGCVKKIRSALEPLTGDAELVEVDLEKQTVALPEGVDADEAARIVTETGARPSLSRKTPSRPVAVPRGIRMRPIPPATRKIRQPRLILLRLVLGQ